MVNMVKYGRAYTISTCFEYIMYPFGSHAWPKIIIVLIVAYVLLFCIHVYGLIPSIMPGINYNKLKHHF